MKKLIAALFFWSALALADSFNTLDTSAGTVAITAGTINGAVIGGTTPAAGTFTTINASGLVTPSTTSGIKGTTAADNANAGSVGEVQSCTLASGSAVSLTTATTANVCTINTLPAGDWECGGVADYTPGATTSVTQVQQGLAVASATLGAQDTFSGTAQAAEVPTALTLSYPIPQQRVNVSSATQIWLVAKASFTVSTLSAYGTMRCRRVR